MSVVMSRAFATPVPPPYTTIVANDSLPGIYVVAHDKFILDDTIHIASAFHRTLTRFDEFILGLLSVLFIILLSEVIQVILLRDSRHNPLPNYRLLSAVYYSQFTHLHSLLHCFTTKRLPSISIALSLAILILSAFIFAFDVVIIALTQPTNTLSSSTQYNLRGEHPVLTDSGLGAFITRVAYNRPCVSPIMSNSTQTRRFQLRACLNRTELGRTTDDFTVDTVSVHSWYHDAGSDHHIHFPPGDVYLSTRVDLVLSESMGGERHVLFHTLDTTSFVHARHIHNMVIHLAKNRVCKKDEFPKFCENAPLETAPTSWGPVRRTIELWPGKTEDVIGVRSVYANISMPNPWPALLLGAGILAPSSIVREVSTGGRYLRVNDGVQEDGIDHLFAEQTRITGVPILSLMFAVLLSVLLVLRAYMKPMSLAELALKNLDAAFDRKFGSSSQNIGASGDHLSTW